MYFAFRNIGLNPLAKSNTQKDIFDYSKTTTLKFQKTMDEFEAEIDIFFKAVKNNSIDDLKRILDAKKISPAVINKKGKHIWRNSMNKKIAEFLLNFNKNISGIIFKSVIEKAMSSNNTGFFEVLSQNPEMLKQCIAEKELLENTLSKAKFDILDVLLEQKTYQEIFNKHKQAYLKQYVDDFLCDDFLYMSLNNKKIMKWLRIKDATYNIKNIKMPTDKYFDEEDQENWEENYQIICDIFGLPKKDLLQSSIKGLDPKYTELYQSELRQPKELSEGLPLTISKIDHYEKNIIALSQVEEDIYKSNLPMSQSTVLEKGKEITSDKINRYDDEEEKKHNE